MPAGICSHYLRWYSNASEIETIVSMTIWWTKMLMSSKSKDNKVTLNFIDHHSNFQVSKTAILLWLANAMITRNIKCIVLKIGHKILRFLLLYVSIFRKIDDLFMFMVYSVVPYDRMKSKNSDQYIWSGTLSNYDYWLIILRCVVIERHCIDKSSPW